MTTKEFLIEKNKLVYSVTGLILVPEEQIVDTKKVHLDNSRGIYDLNGDICPYCILYYRNVSNFPTDCCSECPMSIAGNNCGSKDSTWRLCRTSWLQNAVYDDNQKLQELVIKYNTSN